MTGTVSPEDLGKEAGREVLSAMEGSVNVLTLHRPHRLNAVSGTLYEQLIESLGAAGANPGVRCVVLTGSGRAFSAGADVKAHRDRPLSRRERRRYINLGQSANRLIQTIRMPVVAAVNGHAIGAGLELALSADLAVVADDAKLRMPELVLGTFVGGGAVYTLAQRVGVAKAREIVFFGDFFSGAQAEALGIVNRAVPAETVLPLAMEWAQRLARRSPVPLARAKELIGAAAEISREEALQREAEVLEAMFDTQDWAEGIAAFHAGRRPKFEGR